VTEWSKVREKTSRDRTFSEELMEIDGLFSSMRNIAGGETERERRINSVKEFAYIFLFRYESALFQMLFD